MSSDSKREILPYYQQRLGNPMFARRVVLTGLVPLRALWE